MSRIIKLILALLVFGGSGHICAKEGGKIVVAYVSSWTATMPDPALMTHINYAFGAVNETFDGVDIANVERFRAVVGLKKRNPQLKVLLSIGGWGSGRFSEMASSAENRMAFAHDCLRVALEYGLDGIDIDWEYPTQGSAGISCSPKDTDNFTLLMRDLRKVLGRKMLLTVATVANGKYINFRECVRYMDFVNVMSYDMGNPPYHHSALYPSSISGWCTGSQAVEAHLEAGVPKEKLVMGLPFYGRGDHKNDILHNYVKTKYTGGKNDVCWNDTAKVPYLADKDGKLVLGMENTYSLALKCQYIIDNGLLGGMYWEYAEDNAQLDQARTVSLSLMKNGRGTMAPRRVLVLAERGGQHEEFTAAALEWLKERAEDLNMELNVLESAKDLGKGEIDTYNVVLQLNYPPYAWSDEAMADFERYIDEGRGSYIGFHHATLLGDFDGYPMWQWFCDFMGRIRFKGYVAQTATGTVCVERADHPVMEGLPAAFDIPKDEWYTYDVNPRPHVYVLAHVDEASYVPASNVKMGDHPVIWTNTSKRAKNVYFQIGHHKELMDNVVFIRMFENALKWVMAD